VRVDLHAMLDNFARGVWRRVGSVENVNAQVDELIASGHSLR